MSYNRIVFETKESADVEPITIHAIKSVPVKKHKKPTDNFLEFHRIYGHLFKKNFGKKTSYLNEPKIASSRPRIAVKTIQLEMPVMGEEKAVIKPKETKNIVPKKLPPPPKPQKKNESKDTSSSTHDLMRKLSKMEHSLSKDSKISVHQATSTLIDITNRELEIAGEQLRHIKELIEQKQVQTQTAKQSFAQKIKKKTNHTECEKKYLSNLSIMRRKLKDLEKKFQSRQKVVYKSVNERFTQASLETLYKNQTFSRDTKLDETLDEAISELQDIVNNKLPDELDLSNNSRKGDNTKTKLASSSTQVLLEKFPESTSSQTMVDLKMEKQNLSSRKFPTSTNPVELTNKRNPHSKESNPLPLKDTLNYPYPSCSSKVIDDFLAGKDGKNIPVVYPCSNINSEHASKNNSGTNTPCGDYMENSKLSFSQKSTKSVRFAGDFNKESEPKKYGWLGSNKTFKGLTENENVGENNVRKTSVKIDHDLLNLDDGDDVSKCIDISERKLKKYLHLKQDVADINAFCDQICNLTQSDEEDEDEVQYKEEIDHLSALMEEESNNLTQSEHKNLEEENDTEDNIFDNTKLQDSVMKSDFLMKEFNIKPKIFIEKSNGFNDKKKFYQNVNKCKESGDGGVKNLLSNLEFALENSVYTVGDSGKM